MKTYDEIPPPARLAADVQCVWWSSFGGSAPILPDGCLDLVVGPEQAFIAGPDTAAVRNTFPTGVVVRGIRFRTGRAPRVLGVPANELRDQRVALSDLWGKAGRQRTEQLIENPALLTTIVEDRLAATSIGIDSAVDRAVHLLSHGGPRVASSLRRREISERQFRRRFTSAVGYGPATFLRVSRLQRVRELALVHPAWPLAELAVDAGYADQAHLSREVRALCGMTAKELLRGRSIQDLSVGAA